MKPTDCGKSPESLKPQECDVCLLWQCSAKAEVRKRRQRLLACGRALCGGQCPAEPPDADRTEEYREREAEQLDRDWEQAERELHGDGLEPSFYSR